MEDLAVAVPTKDRPGKLARCLQSLSAARDNLGFPVYVCDSSTSEATMESVRRICSEYPFVTLHRHTGANAAAARNECARVATSDLIVSVDDDIRVFPDAIDRLVAAYYSTTGLRVVAGSVCWDGDWSTPVVMRLIGYGRKVRDSEPPDFLISAFLLYPRIMALTWPWNEHIRTSEDRFMGALWRRMGVALLFDPLARAVHDEERVRYGVGEQSCHIYANLFDAAIAAPRIGRLLSYELLGFAAGAKLYCRHPRSAVHYLTSWIKGHRAFLADLGFFRELLARRMPEPSPMTSMAVSS